MAKTNWKISLGVQMLNTKLVLSSLRMEMVGNALLYMGVSRLT